MIDIQNNKRIKRLDSYIILMGHPVRGEIR